MRQRSQSIGSIAGRAQEEKTRDITTTTERQNRARERAGRRVIVSKTPSKARTYRCDDRYFSRRLARNRRRDHISEADEVAFVIRLDIPGNEFYEVALFERLPIDAPISFFVDAESFEPAIDDVQIEALTPLPVLTLPGLAANSDIFPS
jgi:hypothetical protein